MTLPGFFNQIQKHHIAEEGKRDQSQLLKALQIAIMDKVKQIQQGEPWDLEQDEICKELFQKQTQHELSLASAKKDCKLNHVAHLRIHQLALAKLLVITHNRHPFRLVLAHHNLAQAYMDLQCFPQAIQHLSLALRLNNKHFGELKQTKPLQVILLFMLGKCFISSKNEEDALEQFNKAVEMVNNMKNEYEYDLSNLYRLIVKSLLNQGNPDGAMEFANKIVSGCLGKYGELSTEYSEAIGLLAEVYAKKGESHHSSKILAQYAQLLIKAKFQKPLCVAQIYAKLSIFKYLLRDLHEASFFAQKAINFYKSINEVAHASRLIELKLWRSMVLYQIKDVRQAIKEIKEACTLQQDYFGAKCAELSRTRLMAGCLLLETEDYRQAVAELQKAQQIAKVHCQFSVMQQVKQNYEMARLLGQSKHFLFQQF